MYQITEGQVERNEQSTIPYTWIRGEQPNKSICIMLPGLGYSTERPLFHYATGVCLNQNVDVLHINYNFRKNQHFKKLNNQEQDSWMYDDVKAVVAEVLKATKYEQCIVLSKSIGTIPMANEWKQRNFIKNAIGIWLTPLLKIDAVYDALLKTQLPSLCVIGDEDHHYLEEQISSLKKNEHVSTVVIPTADHGLEIKGDTLASIDAAKEVFKHIHDFITKNKIKE
ncbi:alpha/beta hydrolase [Neobacillus novalis]|uniref:Alpha/beta hydrolase n=1 Tax=Neobacillus novalis TaxID=220687 RepID=A0AA95MPS8_9BACI|nr:alpha/beta family hydrolase [Neobacillus novalis]WHY87212.1 alpha/beta hydrolase [Neobacillus novalis]